MSYDWNIRTRSYFGLKGHFDVKEVSLGQTEGHDSAWEITCVVCSLDLYKMFKNWKLGLIMPSKTTKLKQSGRKFSLNLQSCIIITTVCSVLRICFQSAVPSLILISNEVSLPGRRRRCSLQRLFGRTYVHRHTKQQKVISRYSHLNCGPAKPDLKTTNTGLRKD